MSKSKEEILNDAHWKYVTEKGISSIHTELFPGAYKEQAEIAMDQFSKIQCIAFDQWKSDNKYYCASSLGRYYAKFQNGACASDYFTSEQLYDLFIQHQNSKQS